MKVETTQFKEVTAMQDEVDMQAYWMPYTPNRYFRKNPKIMVSAKGVYYTDDHGRKLLDGASGLWTSPLGHGDPRIIEAIQRQYHTMDYVPAFQMASKETFRLANRIAQYAPNGLGKVFFVNSGSEAVDTALKMALAYHRAKGEASRTRMIGRERAYHGGCVGGISVGGIPTNRKMFGAIMMPGVDHLPHTLNLSQMAFSRGQPTWGAHLADDLERIVLLHDASNIAAVILEPVQGSTGVIVPPLGYLEKIREICTKHGILLIFDEVITGFGRLAANFGADRFGVKPDMITFAKAITNGVIPMGGVIVRDDIYETITGIGGQEQLIEFFHGYTYSGHPLATAAAHACLDIFETDDFVDKIFVVYKKYRKFNNPVLYFESILELAPAISREISVRNIFEKIRNPDYSDAYREYFIEKSKFFKNRSKFQTAKAKHELIQKEMMLEAEAIIPFALHCKNI
jgi:beta-alanine--pyruvate transaminase